MIFVVHLKGIAVRYDHRLAPSRKDRHPKHAGDNRKEEGDDHHP